MREYRIVLMLAFIFAFRMLGLFMILPVFSLYAQQLEHTTPALIGIALGIYGLTQACLQIPFGFFSDHIGRKPVITGGLLLFAAGSVVAALSHSIMGVIVGRALQGAGAIGSTIIALTADLTQEKNRTKAMAIIGIVIGLSFTVAMALGPLLNHWIHVNGIFWFTGLLALGGILILHTQIPTPTPLSPHDEKPKFNIALLKTIFSDPLLCYWYACIFILHLLMTATFVVLPIALQQINTLPMQWYFYLPILAISILLMIPLLFLAEKKSFVLPVFLISIIALNAAQIIFYCFHSSTMSIVVGLILFFMGFNFLEAFLPASISKNAPSQCKGTAMGIYSTAQFLGIFFGGTLGGWLYGHSGMTAVWGACVIVACIWLIISARITRLWNLR